MPITVICLNCSAKLNAPDTAAGKKVKCPKAGCGSVIAVPEPVSEQFEVVDDKAPPKPTLKKAVKATVEVEVDDDEDDRPKKKKRRNDDDEDRPKSKRRRDEDDDEDDDQPRKKKKKKKAAGISPLVIAGIALGGLLVLGGVGYGVYALGFKDSKKNETSSSSGGGDSSGQTNTSNSGSGSSSVAKTPVPKGWVEFNQTGTGFKAYFPVKPTEGNISGVKLYDGEDKTAGFGCTVITQVTLKQIVPEKRKEAGEELARVIFEAIGSQVLSRKDATLAGIAGTELLIAEPEKSPPPKGPPSKSKTDNKPKEKTVGRGVFRVIVTETTLIIAGTTSDSGIPSSELTTAFFDNFELVR